MSIANPLFDKSTVISDLDAYLEASKEKRISSKSAYYSIKYALQILPDILDMLRQPGSIKLYKVADFQITSRSMVLLLSNAWQYLMDYGLTDPRLKAFVKDEQTMNSIKELRARSEIVAMTNSTAIQQRITKFEKQKANISKKEWQDSFRTWLNGDYDQPFIVEGLVLNQHEVDKFKSILSNMSDIFEYDVTQHRIAVKAKGKASQ